MSGELTEAQLLRIGELNAETLPNWWRRFYRERGIAFTERDIEALKKMDREAYRELARRDREEGRYE